MHVGICKVKLHLPGSQSLKDKRQVVKSLTTRVRNSYNVSIAEVESQELWQLATLGICCAGLEATPTRELLYRIVDFISCNSHGAEVVDCEVEVLSVF
ncbi:MAG: DUF503 domain-containing protein [Chloroflexota bacterium]